MARRKDTRKKFNRIVTLVLTLLLACGLSISVTYSGARASAAAGNSGVRPAAAPPAVKLPFESPGAETSFNLSRMILTQADEAEPDFNSKADGLLRLIYQAARKEQEAVAKGAQAEPNDKADAEVSEARASIKQLERMAVLERRPNGTISLSLTVRLNESSDDEIKAAGFAVAGRVGDVVSVQTDVEHLPQLAALASVRHISAATYMSYTNDFARQFVGIDSGSQRVLSQTGAGVLVGVMDSGIDFRHPDFTVPGTNGTRTRIKALLDMTIYNPVQAPNGAVYDRDWNYYPSGSTIPIGYLYTEATINLALQNPQRSDIVTERDLFGHGTHVTGTTAGGGQANSILRGMAHNADIIFIKASNKPDGSDAPTNFTVTNALAFFREQATSMGKSIVVNMSFGGHIGAHDGTDDRERAIDNFVASGRGRVVCVAAGNDGDKNIHASSTGVPTGGRLDLQIAVPAGQTPGLMDLYYSGSDRFTVSVTRPDGAVFGPVNYPSGGASFAGGLQVVNFDTPQTDNDQREVKVNFGSVVFNFNSVWVVTLFDNDTVANDNFDAWLVGGSQFLNFIDNQYKVAIPGTARRAITVGAYVSRQNNSYPVGSIAPFSNAGPTADGRQKPEISTPGLAIISTRSRDSGGAFPPIDQLGYYASSYGTSMATPVVTGAIALLLQANPYLTGTQVRNLIAKTATKDSFTGSAAWNSRFGYGKLNIASAINAVPANNDFINARAISGGTGSATGSNLGGSREPGETNHAGVAGGGSVWYRWQSPSSGSATFDTAGSNFDTLLAVYTGSSVGALTAIASSDDVSNSDRTSRVTFNAVAGTTYYIAVDGFDEATGNFTLNWNQAASTQPNLTPYQPVGWSDKIVVSRATGTNTDSASLLTTDTLYLDWAATNNGDAPVTAVTFTKLYIDGVERQGWSTNPPFNASTSTAVQDYQIGTLSAGQHTLKIVLDVTGAVAEKSESDNEYTKVITVGSAQTIQLNASSYSVNEATVNTPQGFGTLSVNVTRSGDASSTATVQYLTSDQSGGNECNQVTGFASQRCDYATAAGTLRFAAGEATKQLQLSIINDGYIEGPETFTLKLQNPVGAALGANAQAAVTIVDRGVATTPAANAYLSNEFFVRMNYLDFLAREPDAGGWTTWPPLLNSCGPEKGFLGAPKNCDRAFVSHGFIASAEFTDRGYRIYRMYEVGLLRLPRYNEFVPDMAAMSGAPGSTELEQNTAQFAETFTTKQQFITNYGDVTAQAQAAQLIQRLEQNAGVTLPATTTTLPGQPPQYNRQDLINKRLSGVFTVGQTLRAFVEQKVVYDRYFERGFVTMQYFGYLRRDPDLNDPNLLGWTEWVFVFTNGGAARNRPDILSRDIHHLIFGFIYSEEYRKRFGQP